MSKCCDHKPPFRTRTISAQRSKSPGYFPSLAGVESSNMSNRNNKHVCIRRLWFSISRFPKKQFRDSLYKKARAIECTIQNWDCIWIVYSITLAPHGWGGMLVNCSVLNHVCQLCQGMVKYAISIDNLNQNYITRGYVCEFLGPHTIDKHTFLETKKCAWSFGPPGPLRTAFELKNCTVDSKKIRRMRLR